LCGAARLRGASVGIQTWLVIKAERNEKENRKLQWRKQQLVRGEPEWLVLEAMEMSL
jgi:hypothetical protein